MIYIVAVLMFVSFFVCLTLAAKIISGRITLDRYKFYRSIGYMRNFYEREYDIEHRKHKKIVRYYFAWLAILIMNIITGYSLL